MVINNEITLDISKQTQFVKISIPQGDAIDRVFKINLINGVDEYIIPAIATVRFEMTRPNGSFIYNNCPVENNQAILEITPSISAVDGRFPAQFRITDSSTGGLIKSFRFHILIHESVDIENAVVNTSEFTALQDMELRVGDITPAIQAAETATDNANNAADSANDIVNQLEIETLVIWKPYVSTYADIATTYPTPELGWTTQAQDTGIRWRYNGVAWINIGVSTDDKVGDLSTVTTTNKTNVVSAINEVNSQLASKAKKTFVTPEEFGAIGDGEADDSAAFQNALNYCYENKTTLFLPDDKVYRICTSLTLKSYTGGKVYTIRAHKNKNINIYADIESNGALFIGENYTNNNWTTVGMFMEGVYFRVYNSNNGFTGNLFTAFRALIFTNESLFDFCYFHNFGIIYEGTIKVVSSILDCMFFGIKECFMSGSYKVNGVFNDANYTGCLADSKIINSYLSGSPYYLPICFRTNNFDTDTQINECFIENFRIVFGYVNGRTLVGCDVNNCIIQQSCRLLPPYASRFKFNNCWFYNFNQARIEECCPNVADLETLLTNKVGIVVAETSDLAQFYNINFDGCRVGRCEYFVYVKSLPTTESRAKLTTYIKEKNTTYQEDMFIESPIIFSVGVVNPNTGAYGLGFHKSWFDTLQNIVLDVLPDAETNASSADSYLNSSFMGQIIHSGGNIYIASIASDRPVYKQIG